MLNYIKTNKCPYCGCMEIVEESVKRSWDKKNPTIRKHISGGTWEKRGFLCGTIISYIPNYGKDLATDAVECGYSPEARQADIMADFKDKLGKFKFMSFLSSPAINFNSTKVKKLIKEVLDRMEKIEEELKDEPKPERY
jgi:hypothetical protein